MLHQIEPEVIRMTKKTYDRIVDCCRKVQEHTDDPAEANSQIKYANRHAIPTVEALKKHDLVHNLRHYLPFMVYYREPGIYEPATERCEEELERTREYLEEVMTEYLDIIDDEAMEQIEQISPAAWKSMPFEKRVDMFRELVSYYGSEEFNTFLKDLGYQRYMQAYEHMTRTQYQRGMRPALYEVDMRRIWEAIQQEYSEWAMKQKKS